MDYEAWITRERATRQLPPLVKSVAGGEAKPAGTTDSEGKVDDNA
jgi:hypothetical protein